MKIFYHNDADGACAAHIILKCMNFHFSPDLIEIDYNKEFPIKTIKAGETIFIVDFSIEPDIMDQLRDKTKNVMWIDHHTSSIEKYNNYKHYIEGLRSTDFSGCELTWLYLNLDIDGHKINISEDLLYPCPRYIRLIGDRDTWTFRFGNEAKYLHEAYLNQGRPGPTDQWWDLVSSLPGLNRQLSLGETLLKHTEAIYTGVINMAAYETDFEGHKILVCNAPIFTSELFGERVEDYPFVGIYCYLNSSWKVSLYSVNMDVVDIAEKYGGGGHPRACGFISKEPPFSRE